MNDSTKKALMWGLGAVGLGITVVALSRRGSKGGGGTLEAPKNHCDDVACPQVSNGVGEFMGWRFIERVYIPSNATGVTPQTPMPLIFYFHDLGGHPGGRLTTPFKNLIDIPLRIIAVYGEERFSGDSECACNPAIEDCGYAWWCERASTDDQDTLAAQMESVAKRLEFFISAISCCYEHTTVGLTGISQGALMTSILATMYPGTAKFGVAHSGWVPVSLQAPPKIDLTLVHGNRDTTVNFARTQTWADTYGIPMVVTTNAHAFAPQTWWNTLKSEIFKHV